MADLGAVDQIVQGFTGLMHITGTASSGPLRAGIAVADMAAGSLLTSGILLALLERQRTGQGQLVHVSLVEALLSFLDFQAARWTVDHEDPLPSGNDHPTLTPMGTYRAADGYLNIAAPTDRLWARLCEAMDATDLREEADFGSVSLRHANRDRLNKVLDERLTTRSRAEWITAFEEVGVPCGSVHTVGEAFDHPQVTQLGVTTQVEHPTRGVVSVLRSPITLSNAPHAAKTPAPLPGQHTREILMELGYDLEQILDLTQRGVV
jgi:crotonobetainyl-CoA:carnitine CoA-transferase CaiB-like acyl-CoA transferase